MRVGFECSIAMAVYGRDKKEPSLESLTKGERGVDWSAQIDFESMREYKKDRTVAQLKERNLGAVLTFRAPNIRYVTSTYMSSLNSGVGGISYSMLTDDGYRVHWTSADRAYHNRREAPWIDDVRNSSPGTGAVPDAVYVDSAASYLREKQADDIAAAIEELGLSDEVIGLDAAVPELRAELEARGIECSEAGADALQQARLIKCQEEIQCLRTVASIVDGGFKALKESLETGVRENEVWANVTEYLNRQGADVGGGYLASGPRTWPKPHGNITDRRIRPGDIVISDIYSTSFMGYNSCYYRTFSVGDPSEGAKNAYDQAYTWLYDAIEAIEPGVTTDEVVAHFPDEAEIWCDHGVENDWETSTNNWAHGIGLSLYEPPFAWRPVSQDHPMELEEGMTFAIETQAGIGDGQGVRIEEMCVVVGDGVEVLSQWPSDEITVCDI